MKVDLKGLVAFLDSLAEIDGVNHERIIVMRRAINHAWNPTKSGCNAAEALIALGEEFRLALDLSTASPTFK